MGNDDGVEGWPCDPTPLSGCFQPAACQTGVLLHDLGTHLNSFAAVLISLFAPGPDERLLFPSQTLVNQVCQCSLVGYDYDWGSVLYHKS